MVARGLAAFAFSVVLCAAGHAAPIKRDWKVPDTKPGSIELTRATDDMTVSVRRVGMRTREGVLDAMGPLVIYPVVMSPKGVMYYGFERTYPPGTIGRRWLYWDFPTQFRALDTRVRTEQEADFGDHLLDSVILDTGPEKKVLPSGVYQVKWVVGGRLIDNGDVFKYGFHKSEVDH